MPNYNNNFKYLRGFTYLGILFFVAFIGIGLAAAGTVWSVAAQRSSEKQLLLVGHSIRSAIQSYYLHGTGAGQQYPRSLAELRQCRADGSCGTAVGHQYPQSLDELVQDNRSGMLQRHLRKIPVDPMTNSKDWNVITLADGGIIGVSSRSQRRPIKRSNFAPEDQGLADTDCYCDWRFVYLPALQDQ